MNQELKTGIRIEEEALNFYKKHHPLASQAELDKEIKDWQKKVSSSKGLVSFFNERVGDVKGKTILDVGFGSGGIAAAFSLAGAIVSGIDVEPDLKPIADKNVESHGAKADLQIYNGTEFPFPDNSFDYVICSAVLEHVSFPEVVLKEIFRVLKPKGRVWLALPNKYWPKETHTLVYFVSYMPRKMADMYLKILKRSPLEDDNLHFYSYFDVLKMVNKTCFKYNLIYKDAGEIKGFKKFVVSLLKKLGIHYTVFLKQLMFVIEKE
jgi:ubiquinone/menaquinone biosynthesis C-methylase UbiE